MTDTKTKPWTHNYIQRWNPPNRSLRLPTQKQELDHRELTGPHSHRLPGFLSCLTKHCCCCPVIKPCLTFWKPMDCSTLGFPVLHYLPEFAQTHAYGVGDAIQPSHPLSSPFHPALDLSHVRFFSSESVLHITWPKYWSFSFSISPSNEYSGLISFRIDWFDKTLRIM